MLIPTHTARPRRWEWALLAGILILAAALRLGAPGITEFKRDEANLSQLGLNLARGRDLPLLGIDSSVGIPNPPINVYLFALPYVFDSTPLLATLFVGLLNVVAVGLTWCLARRYGGPLAAAVAGVLYAASPWAIIYSRKIWAQDLLPPFVVATVFTGLLGLGEGKRWARWLHWPLLVITIQIHYGAITLLPLSVLMLLLWRQRIPWRNVGIGLLLASLTILPVLAGAIRADLLSIDTLRHGLDANQDHTRRISSTALDHAWLTVAGKDIHSLAGPDQFRAYLDTIPDVYPLFNLVPLGAALAATWLVGAAIRGRRLRASANLVLGAWLVVPVLAFTWEWTEVVPHYMIPLMPAAFIACGMGAGALLDHLHSRGARLVALITLAGVLALVAGLQVFAYARLLRFLDTHYTPGGFGTPLHVLLDVREAILDENPSDVIVISQEELAPYEEEPAVWGVLLDGIEHVRFVNGTQTAVIPAQDPVALIAVPPDAADPPYESCAVIACEDTGEATRRFERRPGGGAYVVRPLEKSATPDWLPIEAPAHFANGATLLGYVVDGERVMLAWELDGPVSADYHAFIHALDAGGKRLDQSDRLAWPGRYWRAGDRLVLWFDFPLPETTKNLFVGMYTTDGVSYTNAEVVGVDAPPDDYMAHYGVLIPLDGATASPP